jgi:hypothetical protein
MVSGVSVFQSPSLGENSTHKMISYVDMQKALGSGIQGIVKSKDKKKEFYLRGHLKQSRIDINNISIDVKRATNYFDDEDEIRNAKMMVRDILKP